MSRDGFIAGANDGPGDGGLRLHEWLGDPASDYPLRPVGAQRRHVRRVQGHRDGRRWPQYLRLRRPLGGGRHGVPIYVPHPGRPAAPEGHWPHHVPDAKSAVRQAKTAAGERDVMGHGAELVQSLLRDGLLDELRIHLIPVMLGNGRRLFGADHVDLELMRVLDIRRP
ncbi:hypothetical protein Asera_60240 [Actinocatenispora sera]|uniref:Bacterial bifunctional deaminase-reductase C-terminal domain-containing protein n=2 Tax=Actinocatenispora sera TaxID=390989 RepID=A0A810LCF1_9ACTN|nr:hypothetical protein Asera_60240 [Actinocatenispora sera]